MLLPRSLIGAIKGAPGNFDTQIYHLSHLFNCIYIYHFSLVVYYSFTKPNDYLISVLLSKVLFGILPWRNTICESQKKKYFIFLVSLFLLLVLYFWYKFISYLRNPYLWKAQELKQPLLLRFVNNSTLHQKIFKKPHQSHDFYFLPLFPPLQVSSVSYFKT